ncbi:glycerate kinase, partial [Rhodococcus gordoniae]
MTRILIVPDSFKGTYTAVEVADAIASGVESAGHTAIRMPVADGGEGTLDALAEPLGLARIEVETVNPWRAPCRGLLGMSPDG